VTVTNPAPSRLALGRRFEGARKFQQRYAPFVALGIGVLARVLSHHGVDFAPKAVALLALAWMLPFALARWTARPTPPPASDPAEPTPTPARASLAKRLARVASTTVVVALYRNVLFFLVPIWFGSATLSSINVVFPLALAGMALFSCFDRTYRELVLERPAARTAWGFVILFAALVPAVAVTASLSPRWAAILSAAIAFLLTGAALLPRERLFNRRSQSRIAAAAAVGAVVITLIAPGLPPVPIVCHQAASGAEVVDRELVEATDRLPAGTPRLYAWFAVTLPAIYRQGINFQWYHQGRAAGRPIPSSVVGGRKEGFRTWSYLSAPPPGNWRVDVLTDAGQLICRKSVAVGGPS
jgi:hypothetical protein